MTPKLVLAALVLAFLPAAAFAACSQDQQRHSTSQCGEGQTWDATSQSCIDAASS